MTSKAPGDERDLHALVNAAVQEVNHASERAKSNQAVSKAGARFGAMKLAVIALALLSLLVLGGQLKRSLFGVSQSTVQLEAQGILVTARAAVEKHHALTGQWPDRVPLPSLEALVSMQSSTTGYQLTLSLDGRRWTMDQHGNIAPAL